MNRHYRVVCRLLGHILRLWINDYLVETRTDSLPEMMGGIGKACHAYPTCRLARPFDLHRVEIYQTGRAAATAFVILCSLVRAAKEMWGHAVRYIPTAVLPTIDTPNLPNCGSLAPQSTHPSCLGKTHTVVSRISDSNGVRTPPGFAASSR